MKKAGSYSGILVGALFILISSVQAETNTQAPLEVTSENIAVTPVPGPTANPKIEALRKERAKQEAKNDELLRTKLEQLRLEDEEKRAEQIKSFESQSDRISTSQASPFGGNTQATYERDPNRMSYSVEPRVGYTHISGSDLLVKSRYTVGLGVGVGFSENLAFIAGYQYGEHGVALQSSDPFVQAAQNSNQNINPNAFESMVLKQNVIQLGMKAHFMNQDSRWRPYAMGGAAYAKSFINFSQSTLQYYQQFYGANATLGGDYELAQYLAFLGIGMDVKITRLISLGLNGAMYRVISSKENAQLPNYAFVNPGYNNGYYNASSDKNFVTNSLADTSFYSILTNVSFVF